MNDTHALDRTRQLLATLEVRDLMYRMRRTDAAPDDDALADWTAPAWFCIGYAAVLGVACWIAFTPTGRTAFNALRGWLA